jgi:hypothetical protein
VLELSYVALMVCSCYLTKPKNQMKETYAQTVRRSAINSLTSGQKMSGKLRRSLLRSTGIVVAVGMPPKDPQDKLAAKIAKANHTQRLNWWVRIPRRIANVNRAYQKAVTANMSLAAKALWERHNLLLRVRGALGEFFANQAFNFPGISKGV